MVIGVFLAGPAGTRLGQITTLSTTPTTFNKDVVMADTCDCTIEHRASGNRQNASPLMSACNYDVPITSQGYSSMSRPRACEALVRSNHTLSNLLSKKQSFSGNVRGHRQARRDQKLQIVASSARWWSMPDGNRSDNAGDDYGPYPWEFIGEERDAQGPRVEWWREDIVHLITEDGVVKIGGQRVPHRVQAGIDGVASRSRKFREEDFMDPNQQLCLGSLFDIAATNGLDKGRRFCVLGFCRSIEMLSTVVEDAVREQGGEVVVLEKRSSGLHEKLHLTVAIPLLWGVPPAVDTLNHAIRSGGGIVDKVYKRWEFL